MKLRPRSALYDYQRDKAIPRIIETPGVGAFMGVGTGKTISTLTSLVDRNMPKTLVVAPAKVARRVWHDEAALWEHTAGLRINHLGASSKGDLQHEGKWSELTDPAKRRLQLAQPSDIDTISYELIPWLVEEVDMNARYGAIVFDEVQKLKKAGATRFKRIRTRTAEIPIRVALTGKPVGNHYADLWGEMYCADQGASLGPSKILYMMQYFTAYEVAENVKAWALNYGADKLIHEKIKAHSFSLDPAIGDRWPVRYNLIHVDLPHRVHEMSEELGRELRTLLDSGTELLALSSSARSMKLRQMIGGAVYTDGETWEELHPAKLDALEDLIDELQGEPLLVGYWYKHELARLLKRFPKARCIRTRQDEDDWNARKIEIAFIHPAGAGEGLNLQFGGHNFCWFTMPWSWNFFAQTQGRLPRPGQKCDHVIVHCLIGGDVDEAVLSYIREQEKNDRNTLEAVRI